MKKIIPLYIFVLLIFISCQLGAQMVTGTVTDIFNTPLVGASITWEEGGKGTVADDQGNFTIAEVPNSNTLIISFVGYKAEFLNTSKIKEWRIQLIEDANLIEVQVTGKSGATKFTNDVAKVEAIGVREIQRAACCSLAGCFSTNSNVESNVTNVITDSKELRILGLSGVYNQVLVDGMPLIIGLSLPYGPGSIPGTMIQNIYVSKGANSVLQGFESITGQINMEIHDPLKAPKWYLNAFANSFGESQYNVNFLKKSKKWSNYTIGHITTPATNIDRDGDGFKDISRNKKFMIYNRWRYENPDNGKISHSIGFRYLNEDREGGLVGFKANKHRGSQDIYGQSVQINHLEGYTKSNVVLGEKTSIILLNSIFNQSQSNYFGVKKYDGLQTYINSSLYADYYYGAQNHNLKAGISYRFNRLKEEVSFVSEILNLNYDGTYYTNYDIPGAFVENKFNFANTTILAGLRADHHGSFGWKITPRLLIKQTIQKDLDIRLSAGKGYRRTHVFAENPQLLSSNRQLFIDQNLAPEEAWNFGINAIHTTYLGDITLVHSADAYHTYFQNQVFPDFDREVNAAFVQNFGEESVSHSYMIEQKWTFNSQVDLKASYNHLQVYRNINEIKTPIPFLPKHRWLASGSYSTKDDKWQADVTYHFTGKKALPSTANYPAEFQLNNESDPYQQLDIQLTRRWKFLQIYGGVENVFDFRQEFPILGYQNPNGTFFDPSFNWGPTKGREFFLGVRYSIEEAL